MHIVNNSSHTTAENSFASTAFVAILPFCFYIQKIQT